MDRLTEEDWVEIYAALDTKRNQIENGDFGEEDDDERWIAHLDAVMEKIGPDGENMTTKRTEPVDECGCKLERTVDGLHMVECPLHQNAGELLKVMTDVYDWWAGGDCPDELWTRIRTVLKMAQGVKA